MNGSSRYSSLLANDTTLLAGGRGTGERLSTLGYARPFRGATPKVKEKTMHRIYRVIALRLLVSGILLAGFLNLKPAHADTRIGINVLLKSAPTDALLADLGQHGTVLDVIPEIKAVMLNADASE